jgi:hypothetical protein
METVVMTVATCTETVVITVVTRTETVVITVVTCTETCYYSRHEHGDLLLQSSRARRLVITVVTCTETVLITVTCTETVITVVTCTETCYYSRHEHGDLLLQSSRARWLLLLQSSGAWRLLLLQSSVRCFWRPWQSIFFAHCQCYVRRSLMPSHATVQEAFWRTVEPRCSRAPFSFHHVSFGNCGTACLCTSDMWFFRENNNQSWELYTYNNTISPFMFSFDSGWFYAVAGPTDSVVTTAHWTIQMRMLPFQ